MKTLPKKIRVIEVGPRDGLQNEAARVPTEVKVQLIEALAAAGFPEVEATSFVHPQRVPQLADAEAVLAGLRQPAPTVYSALVPNERGLDRALATSVPRIVVFTAASETFTGRNIGMTIDQSLEVFRRVAGRALESERTVRAYVSTAWVCPFEGEVPVEAVLRVTEALLELGVDEVSLGDTIGVAVPTDVCRRLEVLLAHVPVERLALHFHDTSGTALANVLAGMEMGITTFDSSTGGLGGCPNAPGATGNLATEDLVYCLDRMGIETGVELATVAAATALVEPHLDHPIPSRQYQRLRRTLRG